MKLHPSTSMYPPVPAKGKRMSKRAARTRLGGMVATVAFRRRSTARAYAARPPKRLRFWAT